MEGDTYMHLYSIMKHKISRILTLTFTADVFIIMFLGIFLIRKTEGGLASVAAVLIIFFIAAPFIATFFIIKWVNEKIHWYEAMLDAIPFPISVTDNNMRWTFINRPVENLLKTTRNKAEGKACSNWGATICNTENCGIQCLRRNKRVTSFKQWENEFRVYVEHLQDRSNKTIGHIEIVQDVTELVDAQHTQGKMIDEIRGTSGAISSASSEVTEKTRENAKLANEAASLTDKVKSAAEKGFEQMNQMTQAVKDINEASLSISDVMKTINSIASQTNILALNASVEAVRAGEHGKSFAVVAEEVRNLAAMCAKSADETSILVENCIEKAEFGAKIAGRTAETLTNIISGVNKSDELIKEIAESSEEQSREVINIHDNIERLERILSSTLSS